MSKKNPISSASILTLLSCSIVIQLTPAATFELYGEGVWSHYDFGPDPKATSQGPISDSRSEIDLPRVVFEVDAAITPMWSMEMEMEFEHGGTGSTMEVEYDEFGEIETEIEKGGEVTAEQLFLTRYFSPAFKARVGQFYLPVGSWNQNPHPMDYLQARRPAGESQIIPGTWTAKGLMLLGQLNQTEWKLAFTEGLDATQFSGEHFVALGEQKRFETSGFNAPAFTLALTQHTGEWQYGVSVYGTNAAGNRVKDDITQTAWLGVYSAHILSVQKWFRLRSGLTWAHLDQAELISSRNKSLPKALNVPRTPVASQAIEATCLASLNILPIWTESSNRLEPFISVDYSNSMLKAEHTNPLKRYEKLSYTLGVAYSELDKVRLTADFKQQRYPSSDLKVENTISAGFAYEFSFSNHE